MCFTVLAALHYYNIKILSVLVCSHKVIFFYYSNKLVIDIFDKFKQIKTMIIQIILYLICAWSINKFQFEFLLWSNHSFSSYLLSEAKNVLRKKRQRHNYRNKRIKSVIWLWISYASKSNTNVCYKKTSCLIESSIPHFAICLWVMLLRKYLTKINV